MLKNKLNLKSLYITIGILIILIPLIVSANIPALDYTNSGAAFNDLNTTAGQAGYKTGSPEDIIFVRINVSQIIVRVSLGALGIIFLVLLIIGGYEWMSAGGNEETIAKARKRIISATIGLAIVLLAYAISQFIFSELFKHTVHI